MTSVGGIIGMVEKIYNIFTIFNEKGECKNLSYVIHEVNYQSDAEKFEFLRANVENDYKNSLSFQPKNVHTLKEYNSFDRLGNIISPQLEEFFQFIGASSSPLFIRTPIKDGKVFFNATTSSDNYSMENLRQQLGLKGYQDDWLLKYTNEEGIKLQELINDDYMIGVKLLFNNGLYVSAMKLLLSAIDSISYIEFGNEGNVFIKWMDEFSSLQSIGITSSELWELRNGLLHMTNLHSKKVTNNKVRRISFYISNSHEKPDLGGDDIYYFNFMDLVYVFSDAVANWLRTYNINRDKFSKFVERYDETVSDSRAARL